MIAADDFFHDFLETALAPDELSPRSGCRRPAATGWAFEKFNRRAQDWAIVGVAAVRWRRRPASALVNMGSTPSAGRRGRGRARATGASPADAAATADEGTEPPSDLNASPEYRRHLARVLVGRALATVARDRPMTATTFGAGSLVGVPVRRVEDPTLLRGEGTYIDNLAIPGALHLAFVRSPIAHAEIRSIDTSDARAMPGVVAVYSADDLDFPDHTGMMQLHPAAVRHALAAARCASSATPWSSSSPRPRRRRSTRPRRWSSTTTRCPRSPTWSARWRRTRRRQFDAMESNILMARTTDDIDPLEGADVIVRGRFENQRVAVVPMEGAAIAVIPGDDGDGHQLTVYLGCQMPHMNRGGLAGNFGLEPATGAADRTPRRRLVRRQALGAGGHRRHRASRSSSAGRSSGSRPARRT